MKKSEAKKVLAIMASENEVSIQSVLSVVDMIDDLETGEPKVTSPLLPLPENLKRQYRKLAAQPMTKEETDDALEQMEKQKDQQKVLDNISKALNDAPPEEDPEAEDRKDSTTKDCCKNCVYGLRGEMTWEDGTKHPGRKCRKDGRTHSDDGYCSNYSRRGRKTKETS